MADKRPGIARHKDFALGMAVEVAAVLIIMAVAFLFGLMFVGF
ncbi:MAG: hypothetical protein ACE5E0_02780 [Terriglobia bacterium]